MDWVNTGLLRLLAELLLALGAGTAVGAQTRVASLRAADSAMLDCSGATNQTRLGRATDFGFGALAAG